MDDLRAEVINSNTEDAGILRTSTQRQQENGDPLPIQKEKIIFSANKNGYEVGVWLEFAMPASGTFDTQPLIKALEYFKTMPTIKRVWTSIVNRATRGELLDFLMVQKAYSKQGIILCDAAGELVDDIKDSLESFGVNYKFNKYNSNEQKIVSSILGARTNWRENLTQLHSAEIKYARLGYWVSADPVMGLKKVRIKNEHGKRWILEPDETTSLWFRKMFELSLQKASKSVIVDQVNLLGYRSKDGHKLTVKQLEKYLTNSIYAMVRNSHSQQTQGKALKIKGTGYISNDEYNQINEGKFRIIESKDGIRIIKGTVPVWQTKHKDNPAYPFKKFILCPICRNNLWASAPRGRHGGLYPQYHCQKGHPYWHVSKTDLENTVLEFTKSLKLTDEKLAQYKEALLGKVKDKLVTIQGVTINYQTKVTELESMSKELLIKIRQSKSAFVQQYLEAELEKVETQKAEAIAERDKIEAKQINIRMVIDRVVYFLEHLEKGLLGIANPVTRAAAWSTIFEELPTYQDLVSRTPRLRPHIELISASENTQNLDVGSKGLEPLTSTV